MDTPRQHPRPDYEALLRGHTPTPPDLSAEDHFTDALIQHDRVPFDPLSTKGFDAMHWAPNPVDIPASHEPVIVNRRSLAEAWAPTSSAARLEQVPLSPAAQAMKQAAGELTAPELFASYYKIVQNQASVPADQYFAWELPEADVQTRAAGTTFVYREPATITDQALLDNGYNHWGRNEMNEVDYPGGSLSRSRMEASINLEPANRARSLYNAAYMQLASMVVQEFAMHRAVPHEVRFGIETAPKASSKDSPLPAATVLQRGLLAYDAWRLTAQIDPAAADSILQGESAVGDSAYLHLMYNLAHIRPVSIAAGTNNQTIGFMYAGLDLSALRCAAFEADASVAAQARHVIHNQVRASFGPEFLEMLDALYAAQPDEASQDAFIAKLADALDEDLSFMQPSLTADGILPPQVQNPKDAYHEKPDRDVTAYTYNTAYPFAVSLVEDAMHEHFPAAFAERMERIYSASLRIRGLLQLLDDNRPRRIKELQALIDGQSPYTDQEENN